jgi:hypothetical protein
MALVAVSPKFLEPVGHYAPLVAGVTAMSSGTATVDLSSKFHVLQGAVGNIADASTGVGQYVTFSASGNSLVIETVSEAGSTTGSSLVSWIAFGIPKA